MPQTPGKRWLSLGPCRPRCFGVLPSLESKDLISALDPLQCRRVSAEVCFSCNYCASLSFGLGRTLPLGSRLTEKFHLEKKKALGCVLAIDSEMELKVNIAFPASQGGIFLRGAGDVVRPPRSQRVFGAPEPCEMERYQVKRRDARRCCGACSLADVPVSVWVCQIRPYSPQRLLLSLTKSCRKEENEPNSVFFAVCFSGGSAERCRCSR